MADVIVTRIDDTSPNFALTAAGSSSASVNCGQRANYDLQVVSFNGFAGRCSGVRFAVQIFTRIFDCPRERLGPPEDR